MFSLCDLVNIGKDPTLRMYNLPTTVHSQASQRKGNSNQISSDHSTNVRTGY